jgi:CHAT domain-containing protein
MQAGKPEAALEAAESSRARLLAERAGMEPVASLESRAAAFQQLARRSRSVLLSYWMGPERSFLWAVTGSRISVHDLPPESEIQPLVESYSALVQGLRDPLRAEHPAGRRLFETLIAPAQDMLPPGSRVIIVPDGVLHALNFESLPVPGANPRYWIEDAQVTLASSLSLLSGAGDRFSPPDSMLLIGDPRGSGEDFPQLKYAAAEMDAVPAAFPDLTKAVYRGVDARPDVYLNSSPAKYGLIHFAAHAVANSQSPLDSAVILSGPAGEGKLFARQIMATPLRARLVTISACRGAGAKVYAGEGLVGLAWAFLHAGASNVIAGLWNVDDRSTAKLMQSVYAGMAAGKTPAEALRDAKRALIRSGSAFGKPYYWAPFQLYRRSI